VATLHIEHPISHLTTWLGAFGQFSEARREAGVVGQRIQQPIEDDKYIVVDLDFADADQAVKFKNFLETVVWSSRDLSPGLAGVPRARIFTDIEPQR
jgi:hypothetical protein